MEGVSAAQRAQWFDSASPSAESSIAFDPQKKPWRSTSRTAQTPTFQCSTPKTLTTEKSEDYFAAKKPPLTAEAPASTDEGDKSSQASTVGVLSGSEGSDLGTLPCAADVAPAKDGSCHRKTIASSISRAAADTAQNEKQDGKTSRVQAAAQTVHPTLLGCDTLKSNGRQAIPPFSPRCLECHHAEKDPKGRSTSNRRSTSYRVEKRPTSGLHVYEKDTATPPGDRLRGNQTSEKNVLQYSRQFLLRILLSGETFTREKRMQRVQPPPGIQIRLGGLKCGMKETGNEVAGDYKKARRQRGRPGDVAKVGSFVTGRRLTEARQNTRGVATPRTTDSAFYCTRIRRDGTHVDRCNVVTQNRSRTQHASTPEPVVVGACSGSRSWSTSRHETAWTTQTSTAKKAASPPHLNAKEGNPLCLKPADQSKSRNYNGKWKCPHMPSGVSTRPLPLDTSSRTLEAALSSLCSGAH